MKIIYAIIVASAAFASIGGGQVANPANGHTYLLTSQPLDALAARAQAQAFGGYLVAINDAAENAFIVSNFAPLQGDNAWIGLSDEVNEGIFLWDSGEPLNYSNWMAGEPSNSFDEDYVEINLDPNSLPAANFGRWNDHGLPSQGPLNFGIIEIPVLPCVPSTHVEFSATGPYSGSSVVTPPTNVLAGLTDFTVEFWVRYTSMSAAGYHDVIANFENCSGPSWTRRTMAIGTYQGNVSVLLNSVPGGVGSFSGTGTTPLIGGGLGGWHHVAVVRNGSTVTAYVDGTPDPWNAAVTTGAYSTPLFNLVGPIEIGGSVCGGMVDGGIDELRVWDIALTPLQIANRMTAVVSGSTPNLIAYWRFDAGSGTEAANSATSSGSALDGTLVAVGGGAPPRWMVPPFSQPCTTYSGSGEDLVLATGVNGPPSIDPPVKLVEPGDALTLDMASPLGEYDFTIPVIAAQGFATGSPPLQIPGFEEVWFDLSPGALSIVVLYDGWAAPFPPGVLSPGGLRLGFTMPPFPPGLSIMIQGFVLAPSSNTGQSFTTTDGMEVRIL